MTLGLLASPVTWRYPTPADRRLAGAFLPCFLRRAGRRPAGDGTYWHAARLPPCLGLWRLAPGQRYWPRWVACLVIVASAGREVLGVARLPRTGPCLWGFRRAEGGAAGAAVCRQRRRWVSGAPWQERVAVGVRLDGAASAVSSRFSIKYSCRAPFWRQVAGDTDALTQNSTTQAGNLFFSRRSRCSVQIARVPSRFRHIQS